MVRRQRGARSPARVQGRCGEHLPRPSMERFAPRTNCSLRHRLSSESPPNLNQIPQQVTPHGPTASRTSKNLRNSRKRWRKRSRKGMLSKVRIWHGTSSASATGASPPFSTRESSLARHPHLAIPFQPCSKRLKVDPVAGKRLYDSQFIKDWQKSLLSHAMAIVLVRRSLPPMPQQAPVPHSPNRTHAYNSNRPWSLNGECRPVAGSRKNYALAVRSHLASHSTLHICGE